MGALGNQVIEDNWDAEVHVHRWWIPLADLESMLVSGPKSDGAAVVGLRTGGTEEPRASIPQAPGGGPNHSTSEVSSFT